MALIKELSLEGNPCLSLSAGDYTAILAPALGNNIIRMRDDKRHLEFFRYDETAPYTTAQNHLETYGYPLLYLHNRLEDGILKVSDYTYQLPVNEPYPFHNCLHGFIQKRSYEVVEKKVVNDDAVQVVSQYVYDEQDEMFTYFPVAFTLTVTYTLSGKNGLLQEVSMRNDSKERQLPCGFCSHTSIKAPFLDGTDEKDYVMSVPVTERWELNHRALPTERIISLTEYDEKYNLGTMDTVNHVINNDIFTGGMNILDGKEFHGMYTTHIPSGQKICYEVSKEYGFWCMWNDFGNNGYYCPEPLTWMINAPNLKRPAQETGYAEIAPGEIYQCWQRIFAAD